ncbi:hypothetical protein L9F63_025075, partial [Diploptera punctata]
LVSQTLSDDFKTQNMQVSRAGRNSVLPPPLLPFNEKQCHFAQIFITLIRQMSFKTGNSTVRAFSYCFFYAANVG